MPIMRIKEIANMSSDARAQKLVELKIELARMKTMIRAGGAVEDPTRVRELRKAIAKILTIEQEQKLKLREEPTQPEKKAEKKPKTKEPKEKKAE
jgi:large subunit ribosomal protein L29